MARRIVAASLLVAACEGEPDPAFVESTIRGTVSLPAPGIGLPVVVFTLDALGRIGPDLASTNAGLDGVFALTGVFPRGDYLVRAATPQGPPLEALILDLGYGADITVSLDVVSTWEVALMDGLRRPGVTTDHRPGVGARAAVRAHLGEEIDESGNEARMALVDAFGLIAQRAASIAQASPEQLDTFDLLQAVTDDARGGRPPAFMDGQGDAGPLQLGRGDEVYALTSETLRAEWALAVQDAVSTLPRWRETELRVFHGLMARLRCSPSPVFPPCTPARAGSDLTPPTIEIIRPSPRMPLSGVVTLEVRASDPESGLESLLVTAGPPPFDLGPDQDPAPDRVVHVFNSASISSTTLTVSIEAQNTDLAASTLRAEFPLDNVPRGLLRGWVYKGPASGVEVTARTLTVSGAGAEVLAVGVTDASAHFELNIEEFRGPVLLEARGRENGESVFRDEAGPARMVSWDTDKTMTALVPDFDPEGPGRRVLITPLTTFAMARARGLRAADLDLVSTYSEALALLASHFRLRDPLHVRPTSPDEPTQHPPTEADRYLLALSCLSRQAHELASVLYPASPESVTALDLVRIYERDLEADGVIDGREGLQPLPLPPNAFRAGLARACARFLAHEANTSGLKLDEFASLLETDVSADDSVLFDPDQIPEAFDDRGPDISAIDLSAVDGGLTPEGTGRGTLLVQVSASDVSGVSSISLTIGAFGPVEGIVGAPGVFLLDTRAMPEGTTRLVAHATDRLGRTSSAHRELTIDNVGPRLTVSVLEVERETGQIVSTRSSPLGLHVRSDEPAELTLRLDGLAVPLLSDLDAQEHEAALFFGAEGGHPVELTAVDLVGNPSTPFVLDLSFDLTSPVLRVEGGFTFDERAFVESVLPERFEDSGLAPTIIDEPTFRGGTALTVSRWLTRWADAGLPPNPAVLSLSTLDADPRGLDVRFRRSPGTCVDLDFGNPPTRELQSVSLPLTLGPDGRFELGLYADVLDVPVFDPLAPARALVCLEVTATDAAGNASVRTFDLETIRVAPPLEVELLEDAELPAPRASELEWPTLGALLVRDEGASPPLSLRGARIRNPYIGVDLIIEWVLDEPGEPVDITVTTAPALRREGPFETPFTPPDCWANWPRRVGVFDTEPIMTLRELGWRCEPQLIIPEFLNQLPAELRLILDGGTFDVTLGRLLRGPAAEPGPFATLILGLNPVVAPERVLAVLDRPLPSPELSDARFARVLQGPGRVKPIPLVCGPPGPSCEAYYEVTRGERLSAVQIPLEARTFRLRTRFGREVVSDRIVPIASIEVSLLP